MLFKAPTQTPHISTLLDDLPTRCPRLISKFLGISPATLARWRRTGNAPRLAHLALFWESRWGIQTIELDVHNWRHVHLAYIRSLERENEALRAKLARLVAMGSFGAANDPLLVDRVSPAHGQHKYRHDIALDLDHDTQLAQLVAVQPGQGAAQAVAT